MPGEAKTAPCGFWREAARQLDARIVQTISLHTFRDRVITRCAFSGHVARRGARPRGERTLSLSLRSFFSWTNPSHQDSGYRRAVKGATPTFPRFFTNDHRTFFSGLLFPTHHPDKSDSGPTLDDFVARGGFHSIYRGRVPATTQNNSHEDRECRPSDTAVSERPTGVPVTWQPRARLFGGPQTPHRSFRPCLRVTPYLRVTRPGSAASITGPGSQASATRSAPGRAEPARNRYIVRALDQHLVHREREGRQL